MLAVLSSLEFIVELQKICKPTIPGGLNIYFSERKILFLQSIGPVIKHLMFWMFPVGRHSPDFASHEIVPFDVKELIF
jgi:hypothetical protein